MYIDSGAGHKPLLGHPFAGYYLPYPDANYEGLVSTITEEAPILNWIYVDKDTYEAKYGVRAEAQPNFTGPFDCTRQDRRLTFEGWEGFLAVEESPFLWAIYFDRDDDGLKKKIRPGTRALEIELTRKEKRWKKEVEQRKEEQSTTHAADENQTMRVTTTAKDADAGTPEQKPAPSDPSTGTSKDDTKTAPNEKLDLSKANLKLGPDNPNHSSQSRDLSQRLATSKEDSKPSPPKKLDLSKVDKNSGSAESPPSKSNLLSRRLARSPRQKLGFSKSDRSSSSSDSSHILNHKLAKSNLRLPLDTRQPGSSASPPISSPDRRRDSVLSSISKRREQHTPTSSTQDSDISGQQQHVPEMPQILEESPISPHVDLAELDEPGRRSIESQKSFYHHPHARLNTAYRPHLYRNIERPRVRSDSSATAVIKQTVGKIRRSSR